MPSDSPYRSSLRPEDYAPQRGFNVSIVSVLVYLAGVAVSFFVLGGKQRVLNVGGPTAMLVLGCYVGIFLVAMLISYFAFAGTRSRVVSAVFFCLSVPALVYGSLKVERLADLKIKPKVADNSALAGVINTPPPPPTPKPTPTPVPGAPTYTSAQRQAYVTQAKDAFMSAQNAKAQAVKDSVAAWQAGGGLMPKGLTSKQAIADRRQLLSAVAAANDAYADFITNQDATYRAELEKTPLVPNDVNYMAGMFKTANTNTDQRLQILQMNKTTYQAADEVYATLDSLWGRWKLVGDKPLFTKKADGDQFMKAASKYNAAAVAGNEAEKKLMASGAPAEAVPADAPTAAGGSSHPGAAPAAAPGASLSTPGASAAPVVTPASAVKPTP